MSKTTDKLYYYCKLSTAIEKILPQKQLLLNPIGKTNDPRENKEFIFARVNMSQRDVFDDKISNEHVTSLIRKRCKMLCFSLDHNDFFGYEYSRMWALYGDNHRGVCLAVDKEKFILENQARIAPNYFKEVNYYEFKVSEPDKHIEIDYERINQDGLFAYIIGDLRPNNLDYLFFRKDKEWETEHEYRLIYVSQANETEYCTINNCIDSIYLGIDFNINYLPSILDKAPNIPVYSLDYKGVRLVPIKKHN
jgi:hypothetical protein